jgi:hypothetical protein
MLYSHFQMIVYFLPKKTYSIPNAENKDRTSEFGLRNLNLEFFLSREKKDSHYENESM